ncbi:MAG: hypothetical protein KUG81_09565 [Gammaproteobacteria bacterium]|nr:hypothetical protein [Gammaproteobacteria bacterium]
MDTAGHSATQGGLRGHSIGPLYPFMVVGIGIEDEWVVQHPNGALSSRYETIDEAYMLAVVLKEDLQDGTYEEPIR